MLYFTSRNKHTMQNQSYTEVLREMQDLQQKWRDQTYVLSTEDKERYDLLLQVRRVRVQQFYADGRAWDGTIQSK